MTDAIYKMRDNFDTFQHNLEVMEFQIKKGIIELLADYETSVLCLKTEDTDVTRVLLAQLLRTLRQEEVLKLNYNVIFTDFRIFTNTMFLKQKEEWANNFPDLLICEFTEEEKLEEQFDILKSWVNIIKNKYKKFLFVAKDFERLQRNMMKIGMANIFELKLDKLWTKNEIGSNNEVVCEVENNEVNSNVLNNESTSERALAEDTNVNSVEESNKKSSLHSEVINNDANLVSLLQSLGIEELDAIDKDGNTQLHLIAHDGKTQIVESLLAHGAKKDIKNRWDRTALHLAVESRHNVIVQMLLEHGFNVNATDNTRCTPLHLACYFHSDVNLIEILLKFGADIERQDRDGQTALHVASLCGRSAVVNLLLKHGANINAKDNDGDSPLNYATSWNRPEIVLILLEHVASANLNIKNKKLLLMYLENTENLTNIIQIFENHVITKKSSVKIAKNNARWVAKPY